MMKSLTTIFALMFAMLATCFGADELMIGSDAPKLELGKFLKGDEVKRFEKGHIYVLELWATWCGPCRATIPHLTALQKKYEKVTFIGVAVLEQDPKEVPDFVEEMGKKMDYRVALDLVEEGSDAGDGKVVKGWMEPAQLEGIPAAFIINGNNKIAWIGHPAEMDDPLEKIVEGKWDIEAEAKKIVEQKALQKKLEELYANLQKLYTQFNDDGNPDELLKALDAAAKEVPDRSSELQLMQFQVLSLTKNRVDDALKLAKSFLDSEKGEDAQFISNLAWIVVNPDRDQKSDPKLLKVALTAALKADKLTSNENPSVADTLAKAYFDLGDFANAVKTQERVVDLAVGTRMAADPGIKKRLKQYKKALENAGATKDDGKSDKPAKK